MTLKTIGHLFNATSSFVQHFVPIGEFKLELQSGNAQSRSNMTIFGAVRPWNLTDDIEKKQGTSSMPLQALCIISYPFVNSNLSYSPETLNSGQNWPFWNRVTWKFYRWPSKTIGRPFYATSSFVYHFVPIGEFKFELQSGNAQFGSNATIFRAVRPWNLTDDLEKQWGTSSMPLQALYSISYPLVNSNWSYSPETPNLGQIWWF